MNKNQKGFVHLLLVILFALLITIVIGYYAFKKGQIKTNISQIQKIISPTLTSSPQEHQASTISETDWGKYTLAKYDFEFLYPSKLKISDYTANDIQTIELGTIGLFNANYNLDGYGVAINIYSGDFKTKGWEGLNNFIEKECKNDKVSCSKIAETYIAGKKAKTFGSLNTTNSKYSGVSEYYFEKNDYLFVVKTVFSYPKEPKETGLQISDTLNEILNSMKFSDVKENWLNFTDSKLGIELNHPESWNVTSGYEGGGEDPTITWTIFFEKDRSFQGSIAKEENPNNLSVKEWFDKLKNTHYSQLIKGITNITIDGRQALIIAQPNTCQTAPMAVVFISDKSNIYTITFFVNTSSNSLDDLKILLENIHFTRDQSNSKNTIPQLSLPRRPENIECSR